MRPVSVAAILAGAVLVGAPPAHAASDEDQVRAVLDGMNGSYNRSDFQGFAAHVCADMLKPAGFEAGWYASRKSDGPTQITINSVQVAGSDAVANVRFQSADHLRTLDVGLVRVGSEWKACTYSGGQTV
jgi:hypothetical protein